jgi:hypothetical protein
MAITKEDMDMRYLNLIRRQIIKNPYVLHEKILFLLTAFLTF